MLKAWGMGFKGPPKTMDSVKGAGRLAYLVDTWKVLTKDTWVVNAIKGYQIPLIGNPLQDQKCVLKRVCRSSARGNGFPSAEGSHLSCHRGHRGFYSTIFLVPKKNGQMRYVINLKCLNQWVEAPHFKMEGNSLYHITHSNSQHNTTQQQLFFTLRAWTSHCSQYTHSYPSSIAGPTNHYYKRKGGLLLIISYLNYIFSMHCKVILLMAGTILKVN